MKVLVVGGSGFVGSHLCRELKSRGHSVTALSRSPGNDDLPDGVSKAMGNVTAYDSIEPHFEGMDAVVYLVALSPLFKPKGGNEMHDEIHRGGTENVVRAAEKHGVGRYVHMSALGADRKGDTAYMRAKGEAEEIVRESTLDRVIFRPSLFFGEGSEFIRFTKLLAPPYLTPLPGGGRTRFQPIWIEEFVPMMAAACEDERYVGGTYEIGGPEVLTLADVARIAHGAEGRPVNVVPLPMGLAGVGLSIAGAIPGFPFGADQYRSLKFDNTPAENDVSAFGVDESDLTTLDAYFSR